MKKTWAMVGICALIYAAPAWAEKEKEVLFSPEEKDKIMQFTLEQFWGNAVDSKGELIQPKNDEERKALPVSKDQAGYIIDKGGESALAQWCGVEWQERFNLLMEQMRKRMPSDTQIAYLGVLHGVSQKMMFDVMDGETCSKQTKKQLQDIITHEISNLKTALKDE